MAAAWGTQQKVELDKVGTHDLPLVTSGVCSQASSRGNRNSTRVAVSTLFMPEAPAQSLSFLCLSPSLGALHHCHGFE